MKALLILFLLFFYGFVISVVMCWADRKVQDKTLSNWEALKGVFNK